jgi:beta-fructofuranosidase
LIVYAPRGFGLSEVGDVEVFPEGDRLHLFHLTLPNHDVVQHVVSADGLSWQTVPNALRTGEPGDCDDDQIWTMSVTERGGTCYMVYTVLARAEDGRMQRTALATSTDLIRWTKHSANPVGQPDPRWYEAELGEAGWVSWRDPKPILVDGTYYAAVCARERSGPPMRRGCVGLLASTDLIHWEPHPPLFAPRAYWDLECPPVFQIGRHFYIAAAVMEDRTQRYWVADQFAGPYRVPEDGGILAPRGHYAGRVCRWRDLDLYFCWHKADYDWLGFHNPHGKFVPAPLLLEPRDDGSLARRSYPGWEAYRVGPSVTPAPLGTSLFQGRSVAGGWRLATDVGRDVLATFEAVEDVLVEGTLELAAPIGGLAFRLDDTGGGYFVEFVRESGEVALKKWLPGRTQDDGRPWFRYAELQRGHLRRRLAPASAVSFRLLLNGPYVEASVDGEVVLATATAERTVGLIGIWAESGEVGSPGLKWTRLKRPAHR